MIHEELEQFQVKNLNMFQVENLKMSQVRSLSRSLGIVRWSTLLYLENLTKFQVLNCTRCNALDLDQADNLISFRFRL